ncbi:hypothetical protein [Weissella thailandensis]|uniref:Uncharacterized protein n=1 Tax=Weissella thailandensis TaxID=89061 RepID=A0ABX9I5P8_9LACO|nr:hypothetical protein [Weissella thailandensis]NKY90611.1 hypothetical protein [Weissella thailandensis]RDS59988.1 hypothetical protein DWV05_03060 [Weissella thailandensis]GEP73919.1 hypothetical protein WTH01_01660 [Weissella thailandensis]
MTLTPRISIATMMTVLPLKGKIFFEKSADGYFKTADIGPQIDIFVKDPNDVERMLTEFNYVIDEHSVDENKNEFIQYTDLKLVK